MVHFQRQALSFDLYILLCLKAQEILPPNNAFCSIPGPEQPTSTEPRKPTRSRPRPLRAHSPPSSSLAQPGATGLQTGLQWQWTCQVTVAVAGWSLETSTPHWRGWWTSLSWLRGPDLWPCLPLFMRLGELRWFFFNCEERLYEVILKANFWQGATFTHLHWCDT